MVVADITGHNPNVFYELAIAHGYKRPVIQIGQEGQKPPFDIWDMRTIFYDETDLYSVRECVAKVKESAKTALADPTALKTPLTDLDPFSAIREQARAGSADELIASTLQRIQTQLDRLEGRMERGRDSMETGDSVPASKGSLPIGPVYFTKDYVKRDIDSDKTYPQGGRGVVLREHTHLGRVTHVDLHLPDGEFLLKVPLDYIRTE